jgi:hypothetical protein
MNRLGAELLTVIVGAGASHDCAPKWVNANNARLQPPLASDIFGVRFQNILEHYPRVEAHSDEIRSQLDRGRNLESLLRDLLDSAARSGNNWSLDIPRYIRELFWTISEDFLRGSSKFDTLVRRTIEAGFEKILFVSLNYDLLLHSALERYGGEGFEDIDSYISAARKWSFVKPHGSVNWARILENCPKYGDGRFRAPSDLKESPVFSGGVRVVRWNRHSHDFYVPRKSEEGYLYPEVVVPVEREKVFVCPASHTALADEFVRQCGNFLLIGFSARDEDLLKLLNGMPARSRVTIVGRGDSSEIFGRICSFDRSFETKELSTLFWDEGFSTYVDSSELEGLEVCGQG